MISFSYKKLSRGHSRPIIPIDISCNGQSIIYYALVDSGADITLFPLTLAEVFHIDLKRSKKVMVAGVGGEPEICHMAEMEIVVNKRRYNIEVGFLKSLVENGHGLLGQKGFFDLFKITFDNKNQKITLIKN